MKIDLDQLKTLGELLRPPGQVKDKDSFSDFTSGLRSNWPLLAAIVGVAMWLITNTSDVKNVNLIQDSQIQSNAQAVLNLNKDYENFKVETRINFDDANNNTNEILRVLSAVQKDIEIIKTKQ